MSSMFVPLLPPPARAGHSPMLIGESCGNGKHVAERKRRFPVIVSSVAGAYQFSQNVILAKPVQHGKMWDDLESKIRQRFLGVQFVDLCSEKTCQMRKLWCGDRHLSKWAKKQLCDAFVAGPE